MTWFFHNPRFLTKLTKYPVTVIFSNAMVFSITQTIDHGIYSSCNIQYFDFLLNLDARVTEIQLMWLKLAESYNRGVPSSPSRFLELWQ